MALSNLGKFKNSLKLDARGSGTPVIEGPVYGAGKWLSIRGDGYLVQSTDSQTWTNGVQVTTSSAPRLYYLNNRWIVLSEYAGINESLNGSGQQTQASYQISTSTDTVTWTTLTNRYTNTNNIVVGTMTIDGANFRQANNARTTHLTDLTYSNGYYWLVGYEIGATARSASVYKSSDLNTWTTAYTLNPGAATVNTSKRIRSQGNTIIVAADLLDGSNKIPFVFYSDNGGTSWTVPTNGYNNVGDHSLNSIGYGAGNWVAVGNNGMIYSHYNPSTGSGFIQGTWDQRTGPANTSGVKWLGIEYTNSRWVLVGSKYNSTLARYEEQFYTSPNLITWTKQTTPATDIINVTQTFGNGTHVNIATDGTTTTSWQWTTTNLSTWSSINYRIPNQQPYLDYGQNDRYGTWKTIDFWVYVNSLDPEFVQYPIASQYANDTNYWAVYLQTIPGGHKPYVILNTSDTGLNSSGVVESRVVASEGDVIPGQWNHIRIVRNTGVGTIYINGQRSYTGDTFIAPTNNWPTQGNLTIGRIGNGFESYFARNTDYWIDEFTINSNPLNSPSAETIAVPTERWFSTDTTLLLLHFDYNYNDDASIPITAASPLAAYATVNATATKVVRTTAQLTTTATVTASAVRARQVQAQLSALATEIVVNARTRGLASDMAVRATLATVTKKLNGGSAQLSSQASITANAIKSNGTAIPMDARATLAAQPLRIKGTSITMQVSGVELAAVVKIAQGYCQAFDVNATLASQPVKTARTTANLSSQASINAVAQKVKYGASAMTVQADMVADIGKTKEFDASLTSRVTASTTAKKTARITLDLQANVQQVAQAIRTRNASANLQAFNTLLAVGKRSTTANAQLTTSTEMFTSTGNIVRAVINLDVGAFELVQGNVIRYDPYYKIRIKPEARTLLIHEETRFITIKPETRVNIIKDTL
jgi:Concanavalin A-like lectin/glucanases superfamily